MPRNNAANQKINHTEDKRQGTGFADCATRETQEKLLDGSGSTSQGSRSGNGIYGKIESGERDFCSFCERNEHKYAGGNSGVNKVIAKTAKQALDKDDGEERTDHALPNRNICGKIETEKQTGNGGTKIANRLFLLANQVE